MKQLATIHPIPGLSTARPRDPKAAGGMAVLVSSPNQQVPVISTACVGPVQHFVKNGETALRQAVGWQPFNFSWEDPGT